MDVATQPSNFTVQRVLQAVNSWKLKPWESGDCVRFVTYVVRELTGRDFSEVAEAHWHEHTRLPQILTGLLGPPSTRIPRPGDVVALDLGEPGDPDYCIGVMAGHRPFVLITTGYLAVLPATYIVAHWSCPAPA